MNEEQMFPSESLEKMQLLAALGDGPQPHCLLCLATSSPRLPFAESGVSGQGNNRHLRDASPKVGAGNLRVPLPGPSILSFQSFLPLPGSIPLDTDCPTTAIKALKVGLKWERWDLIFLAFYVETHSNYRHAYNTQNSQVYSKDRKADTHAYEGHS